MFLLSVQFSKPLEQFWVLLLVYPYGASLKFYYMLCLSAFAVFLWTCPIYVQSEIHIFSNSLILLPTSLDLNRLFPQISGQQDEISLRILTAYAANI